MLEYFQINSDTVKERIIGYSPPGVGKSRWGLHLSERFGEIVYYAADKGSEYLASIFPAYRSRIHVIRPVADFDRKINPIHNFSEFCIHNWKKEFPNVKTIVVDTYTKVANDCIMWSANNRAVTAEKHYEVGTPGDAGSQIIPNRGDYMAIQSLSRGFIDLIFEHQKDMHIIFLMHEDISQVDGVGSVGGPAHPGRTMMLELPASFNTVIRLFRKPVSEKTSTGQTRAKSKVIASTDSQGAYIARIREAGAHGNECPEVVLDDDPINFWNWYEKEHMPALEGAETK